MKKIKVFECFAGIGAQHRAMVNLFNNDELLLKNGINKEKYGFEIVGTSEWFIDAIISYDRIHHGEQNNFPGYNTLRLEEMIEFISTYTLSKDSKEPYSIESIKRFEFDYIRELYIALKRNRNYGSIVDIKDEKLLNLPKIDLLTYSFPCQDISLAGHGRGLEEGTNTRSGLLWEIKRILEGLSEESKLPKYLLMENVKSIVNPKHYEGWKKFEDFLSSLGYKNTMIVLNSLEVGIPQSRDRVFCISELNGTINFNIDNKRVLEKKLLEFLDVDNELYQDEYKIAIPNNTISRRDIIEQSKKLNDMDYCFTITTKADRKPNPGVFWCNENGKLIDNAEKDWYINGPDLVGKSAYRYLTGREALLLMGFTNEDYDALKSIGMRANEVYMFAGNSIVVNKLEAIFVEIMKRFR